MISSNPETRETLLAETVGTLAVRRLDAQKCADRVVWMVTERGYCGCRLYCFKEEDSDGGPTWEQELEQRRKRYRAKGWGEAKIRRALEAAEHSANHIRRGQEPFTGLRPDVGAVIERAVALDPATELLVHMTDGDYHDDIPMFEQLRPTMLAMDTEHAWCAGVAPDTRYRMKAVR
ncbi:MAG: hypothetical protein LAT64_07355 [Phycisphaerales bacterium]|nr:hypothetical protein [Planctomycetota bacterium]MCH8508573.1 hypothetical protein [Phycisphaerales bacterium]